MARLALVSRNPIMSMGLSATEHDIVEVRPNSMAEWLAQGNDADVDALVLDLGSASEALRIVGDMRAQGRWTPVLLVASSPSGWDSPDLLGLPGVDLLTLPIDATRLQKASDAVLRHPKAPPALVPTLNPPTNPEPLIEEFDEAVDIPEPVFLAALTEASAPGAPAPQPPAPQADVPEITTHPLVSPAPPPEPAPAKPPVEVPAEELVAAPIPVREVKVEEDASVVPKIPKAPKRPKKSNTDTSTGPQQVTKVKEPRSRKRAKPKDVQEPVPSSDPATPQRKSQPKHGAASPTQPRRRATDRLPDQGPGEVVGLLLESANVLYTLAETAEVIIEDAIDRAQASSGALLVPDGNVWRVAAGVGLRTLEFRYQLTAESWLIEKVGESHRGLLIENSDVARQALHGAPLASRTHLLAVPVPEVTAVLLLSRDEDPPFSESVLSSLAQLAREAGPLLQRAINLRTLSRAMARHLDPEDAPRD